MIYGEDGVHYRIKEHVYVDPESKLPIHLLEAEGYKAMRPYFTQMGWTNDNMRLVLGLQETGDLIEYNVKSGVSRHLDTDVCSSQFTDATITPDNIVYYLKRDESGIFIGRICLDTYRKEIIAQCPNTIDEAWGIQSTNDGRFLSVNWRKDGKYSEIVLYNVDRMQFEVKDVVEFSKPEQSFMGHVMVNPADSNYVFYCHEGPTLQIHDRLWTFDSASRKHTNIFKQRINEDGSNAEPSGHECWSADGRSIYFVKYNLDGTLPPHGVWQANQYGTECEFVNGDYEYLHCASSPDNKWIIADTNCKWIKSRDGEVHSNVILINLSTKKSFFITDTVMKSSHPHHPHPSFSQDSTKISFGYTDRMGKLYYAWVEVAGMIW